ncbi:MAG: DUF4010 domain-containing protein [Saprospiraceae bacterium]|nr:DUF4010 domain-containing protein [Saprospiraceae bacterium]
MMAAGIGALLGLEREFSKNRDDDRSLFAGIRTFPIVSIIGYIAIYLGEQYFFWIYLGVLVGVILLTGISYYVNASGGAIGMTTEFSLIVNFLLAALIYHGQYLPAAGVAILITFLLAFKPRLHSAVQKLSRSEIFSILFFIIITAIMLPVLPNEDYGWYGVFNPFRIWFIVVVFIGLNFMAYFAGKFIPPRHSKLMVGIVGGFVSSTATAWYLSRREHGTQTEGRLAASSIVLASSIMFPRVLVWLFLLNRTFFWKALLPIALLGIAGLITGYWLGRNTDEIEEGETQQIDNPINLKEALVFALLIVGIQLLFGYAEEKMGTSGIYLASFLSGISNIDAITVSLSNMGQQQISLITALIALLIACLTNTLVKYGLSLGFGGRHLRYYTSIGFAVMIGLGAGIILFYLFAG